jgi:dTDP-4-dehydrorhamnose 3,5-epimerase-like enzyme
MIGECTTIDLPRFSDSRGDLTSLESLGDVPFLIERLYYLYGIPEASRRGGHAHKELNQLMIAISGSFDVHLDDGFQKKTVSLSKPNIGLQICPMIWREIDNFSPGAVCLVIASQHYDEEDYFREYSDFLKAIHV